MAATIVPIRSHVEPALNAYTSVRERDLVGRDGLFIAEGEVVLRILVEKSRFTVRSLLLSERRVSSLTDVLAALSDSVPAYVVPQSVMDQVVGFSIHRGVLALGERGPALTPERV